MTLPAIVKGSYIDIMIGDGATPEVFTIVCGLTTRNMTIAINKTDHFINDCANPEDVPVRRIMPTGKSWALSGQGRYNRAQAAVLRAATGVTKNYRFIVSEPAADEIDDGYYEGPAMLISQGIDGSAAESANFATSTLSIESDGAWVWHDAA